MKLHVALIYLSFFGLIGFVCYVTSSALPLFALILTPSYNEGNKETGKKAEVE